MIRYLTHQEVTAINYALIDRYSPKEDKGIKSPSLLDSAVMRPRASVFGEDAYKTLFSNASALFESLAQNHAFQNANKRTAFTAMVQFLRYNGYRFKMDPKEAEDFTVDIVTHQYTFEEIVHIIETHSISE